MQRSYQRWYSPRLGRDLELLVFGEAGARVLVFPTRGGRFFDYEDWGLAAAAAPAVAEGRIQLFCLDSIDYESLYRFDLAPADRLARHRAYESYVLEEVVPFSAQLNPGSALVAHGCSLGAFHAANIAFRHPARFRGVVALSGRYDLTENAGPFPALLGRPEEWEVFQHTPPRYLAWLRGAPLAALRRMEIELFVGEDDPFLWSNLRLARVLHEQGVRHHLDLAPGEAHRARHWRPIIARTLGAWGQPADPAGYTPPPAGDLARAA